MNHDDKVGHAGWLDDLDELDRHELIEQITVDAYGDEAYWSFHQVIGEHVQFPVRASIAGADVTVTEIDFDGDERRGPPRRPHLERFAPRRRIRCRSAADRPPRRRLPPLARHRQVVQRRADPVTWSSIDRCRAGPQPTQRPGTHEDSAPCRFPWGKGQDLNP